MASAQQKPLDPLLNWAVIKPHDLAVVVDAIGRCEPRAGHVDRGIAASAQQEAHGWPTRGARVMVSHDLPGVVDPVGISIPHEAGRVEAGVAASAAAHKAVHAAGVVIVSYD